jgi:hypothetical protein
MSIALLSLFSIFKTTQKVDSVPQSWTPRQRVSSLSITPNWRQKTSVSLKKPTQAFSHVAKKPLRVSRILETEARKNTAGRMVISGSMRDVCAELDRLVMLENSTLTH